MKALAGPVLAGRMVEGGDVRESDDVPARMGQARLGDQAKYQENVIRARSGPQRVLGEHSKRIGWIAFPKVETHPSRRHISIKWFRTRPQCRVDCIDRHLHTRGDHTAIIGEATIPRTLETHHHRQRTTNVRGWANILPTRN